jgi:hypothetical protein
MSVMVRRIEIQLTVASKYNPNRSNGVDDVIQSGDIDQERTFSPLKLLMSTLLEDSEY